MTTEQPTPAPTLWEIVNPSDPYTLACDDYEVVALAGLMLGKGHYAMCEIDGEREVPLFLFGGAEEWFSQTFGHTLSDSLKAKSRNVAEALDSVMIGRPESRRAYETALAHIPTEEGRMAYRAEMLNQQRSSMNNIGKRAWSLANALRRSQ